MTANDPDLMSLDDLPHDARELIADAENSIAAVRDEAERRTSAIRDEAEREVAAIRERAEADIAHAEQEATRELAPLVRELIDSLRAMQERYAREGLLDEALAIRARVRQLRSDLLGVRPDPGNMSDFVSDDAGRVLMFEVVGQTEGSVWGTDVYTGDTRLSAAAVHAGLLREGERGLLRVTLLDGDGIAFEGSPRHGVLSFDYAHYPLAYRIERI
jgi:hypothetical protein